MTSSEKVNVRDVLNFYLGVLNSLSMSADDDGLISMLVGDETYPCMINKKRLVMPTGPILKNLDLTKTIPFHPLAEQINRGESTVIKKLKDLVSYRITSIICCLIDELTELAADKSLHDTLTAPQSELLEKLKNVSASTVQRFEKVIGSISTTGDNKLVSIYLKRGGIYKGNTHSIVSVVSFPIMKAIDHNESKIFDVNIGTKKDMRSFEDLLEYLLPDIRVKESYNAKSDSLEVPYLDALLSSFIKIAKHLNLITSVFSDKLSNPQGLLIDLSWESEMNRLHLYRNLLPNLEGNIGTTSVDERTQSNPTITDINPDVNSPFVKESVLNKWAEELNNRNIADETRTVAGAWQPGALPLMQGNQQQHNSQQYSSVQSSDSDVMSFEEIQARRNQNTQQLGFQQPMMNNFQQIQQLQQPMVNSLPPPGWGGGSYTPNDVVNYNRQTFNNQQPLGQPLAPYGNSRGGAFAPYPAQGNTFYGGGFNNSGFNGV